MMLPHIAARVFNTPLLIHQAKLETILTVLGPRLAHDAVPALATETMGAEKPERRGYVLTPDGIALIPVMGTLVRRAGGLDALSGLTSYARLTTMFDEAMADTRVRAVMFDIDSPGGEAGGVFDLADRIYAARGKKPIWAVANEDAFSAAYAIAAAAERLYVSRTAGVGSVGVIAVHLDQSQAEAEAGLTYTAIYAGARKNDLSPHAPLSDPARLLLQEEVDRVYDLFVSTVTRLRRLSPEAVRATEAGIYMSDKAIAAGLADRAGTLETALADLRTALGRSKNHTVIIHQAVSTPASHAINQGGKTMNTLEPTIATDDPAAPPVAEDTAPAADATLQGQQAPAAVMEAAMAYVAEVTELCQLAGFADRATDLIKQQVPVATVRKALLEARVAAAEASALIGQPPTPETKPGKAKIDTAAIYARRNRPAHNQKENDECLS